MRITGGSLRGKSIEAPASKGVRPSSSRTREAIFNILRHGRFRNHENFTGLREGDLLDGANVIDVFCGSGILGFEAISRGAAHVTFVDQNRQTVGHLANTIKKLGLEKSSAIICTNILTIQAGSQKADLVLLDPPYNQNLGGKALSSLAKAGWLKSGALVILEQGKLDEPNAPEGFVLLDDRISDKTRITIMEFKGL